MPLDPTATHPDHWVITHLPARRCLSFRPGGNGLVQAFLLFPASSSLGYEKLPQPSQITAIRQHLLAGSSAASPVVQRAARGLDNLQDLYLEYSGQIKARHLSTGRISMIGDAAYCGTPLSGAGTTLSLVGAYVLSGSLARNLHSEPTTFPHAAYAAYERFMAPFAAAAQSLPPGVPRLALPDTEWGAWVLHQFVRAAYAVSRARRVRWVSERLFRDRAGEVGLPDYTEYEVGRAG